MSKNSDLFLNKDNRTYDENFLDNQNFQVADDILCRRVENEAILLHIPAGIYYSLSETSLPFWEALQNQQPLLPVVEQIIRDYEVDKYQVMQDLRIFLENLSNYGLICVSSNQTN